MRNYLFVIIFLLNCLFLNAQISGNQLYNNNRNKNYHPNLPGNGNIQFSGNTLSITANIMMEQEASAYRLTVGTNQEEKTVQQCDKKINQRIENLKKNLKTLGIKENQVYVDFISQTKIYDYTVDAQQSTQYDNGFEIKKNIIIQFKDIHLVDKLVSFCAQEGIYDIIKVDYIDLDKEKVFEALYAAAIQFIQDRKDLLMKSSLQKATGRFKVSNSNFLTNYPKHLYKEYQAFETAQLNVYQKRYGDNYIHKEARKNKTFYYDGLDPARFDKIIPSDSPKVGIQYVMSMTIIFELEKPF